MNQMENLNEFTKSFNEFAGKNFEMMNKFWKTAFEQNQEMLLKNSEAYFGHIGSNMNNLMALWTNFVKGKDEASKRYAENMEKLYANFNKVYRETVETVKNTAKKENQ